MEHLLICRDQGNTSRDYLRHIQYIPILYQVHLYHKINKGHLLLVQVYRSFVYLLIHHLVHYFQQIDLGAELMLPLLPACVQRLPIRSSPMVVWA